MTLIVDHEDVNIYMEYNGMIKVDRCVVKHFSKLCWKQVSRKNPRVIWLDAIQSGISSN